MQYSGYASLNHNHFIITDIANINQQKLYLYNAFYSIWKQMTTTKLNLFVITNILQKLRHEVYV